jgi:Domain of unknown function (DUF4129)
VSRLRIAPLVLGVTLLLAIVAITARGRPLGSGGSGGGGLPFGFWDYLYTTIVIVAVPVLLATAIAAAVARRRTKKPTSTWTRMLRMLALLTFFLLLEVFVLRHLHPRLPHLQLHGSPRGPPPGQNAQQRPGPAGSHALAFRWDELVIVLGLVLVVGLAAILAARRSRPDPEALEIAPEALADALDESLDDLRTDADLRRAIVAAYARMERALAAAGVPRRPAEAPLEYVERALLSLETSAGAVRRLTDLFEWARFSHHEPEPSMRDEAVDALIAVRDELRASELTAA